MTQSDKLTLKNTAVNYRRAGEGDLTLIFIHGNSMSIESFDRQFDSSLADKYSLAAIDLPGHGGTRIGDNGKQFYSVPGLISFLVDVIGELKPENYILMGHSLGGHIAIEAAGKLDGLRGIMAWGTPPLTYRDIGLSPFTDHPAIPLIFSENLDEKDVDALSKAYWSKNSEPPSVISKKIIQTDPAFRSAMSKSIEAGEWVDEVEVIEALSCPVALGIGEHDVIVNREYILKAVEEKIWDKKLQIIPGAGHSAHMENPGEFNRWVEEFVESA